MTLAPLSLALAGIDPAAAGLGVSERDGAAAIEPLIEWVRGLGYRAVQLNAAWPGVRPRDLDRSGRRGLAALLRRNELELSGLDLWVPAEHFVDPATADKAASAVIAAAELAAELAPLTRGAVVSTRTVGGGGPPTSVSVVFHEKMAGNLAGTIADRAERCGVRIADHAWPVRTAVAGGAGEPHPAMGIGIDPAVLLGVGADPATEASKLGERVASARLSDVSRMGVRVAPGNGKLDLLTYGVALETGGYERQVVVDLRGVSGQAEAATQALQAWDRASI